MIKSIILKYDFLQKYKIYYIQELNKSNYSDNSKDYLFSNNLSVQFKLKSKYRKREDFIKSILDAKNKSRNLSMEIKKSQPITIPKLNLHLPQIIASNLENTSSRSRNIQNNIYLPKEINNTYNLPSSNSKVYYNTERERYKDNSISTNKHKSISSTIYRDIETLEHLIKDDKNFDLFPVDQAKKPAPRKVISQIEFDNRNKSQSFIIDPDEIRRTPVANRKDDLNVSRDQAKNINLYTSNSLHQDDPHKNINEISIQNDINEHNSFYQRIRSLSINESETNEKIIKPNDKRINSIFEEIKKDKDFKNGNIHKYLFINV